MDGKLGIDHCQFLRGALRHSPSASNGMNGRERSSLKGLGVPQLVATDCLTIGRSSERAHVLVSQVA